MNGIRKTTKPHEDYEVLIPILYLDVKDSEFKIGDIAVKKMGENSLEEYGLKKEKNIFNENLFGNIVNKTVAIIPEKGNNPKLICERARRKADFVIRVLQVSLSFRHDVNLLFKQDETIFYRKKNTPSSVWINWQRGYRPIELEIDERLKNKINKFLGSIQEILDEQRLFPRFRECFVRALTWIGRSIEEEDPDIKIIDLSTALETILTTINDRWKGEALASRMLLLYDIVDKPFVYPAEVLRIYKMRSEIVHGSELRITSRDEYLTMLNVAIDALIYSIEVIRLKGLKSHNKFIDTLESHDKIEQILDWLKEQDDKGLTKILKYMEENLLKYISVTEKKLI